GQLRQVRVSGLAREDPDRYHRLPARLIVPRYLAVQPREALWRAAALRGAEDRALSGGLPQAIRADARLAVKGVPPQSGPPAAPGPPPARQVRGRRVDRDGHTRADRFLFLQRLLRKEQTRRRPVPGRYRLVDGTVAEPARAVDPFGARGTGLSGAARQQGNATT